MRRQYKKHWDAVEYVMTSLSNLDSGFVFMQSSQQPYARRGDTIFALSEWFVPSVFAWLDTTGKKLCTAAAGVVSADQVRPVTWEQRVGTLYCSC